MAIQDEDGGLAGPPPKRRRTAKAAAKAKAKAVPALQDLGLKVGEGRRASLC